MVQVVAHQPYLLLGGTTCAAVTCDRARVFFSCHLFFLTRIETSVLNGCPYCAWQWCVPCRFSAAVHCVRLAYLLFLSSAMSFLCVFSCTLGRCLDVSCIHAVTRVPHAACIVMPCVSVYRQHSPGRPLFWMQLGLTLAEEQQ